MGRIMIGIATGLNFVLVPLYIKEMSPDTNEEKTGE